MTSGHSFFVEIKDLDAFLAIEGLGYIYIIYIYYIICFTMFDFMKFFVVVFRVCIYIYSIYHLNRRSQNSKAIITVLCFYTFNFICTIQGHEAPQQM